MTAVALGRLEHVDLRNTWPNEATNFTPWLAQEENLRLLGDTIGIELELEATEKEVGPFHADLLCRDTATGAWVLIENQLERTDHSHLGQLLTYAAGLQAVTIVWIAKRFTEEHRAALDWLNEITDERFNFFGLEIELWRIGESAPAPKFNVVGKPNDWTKSVAAGAARVQAEAVTEAKQLQLEFWRVFREYAIEHGSTIKPTKPLPQNWMTIALGRGGFGLTAVASFWDSSTESYESNEIRAEVFIATSASKTHFAALESQKYAIEAELGEPLIWYNSPDVRTCRIFLRRSANLRDREDWPQQHEWLLSKLEGLHRVFGLRVRHLDEPR